ncbi:MAG: glycosyltransferase family 1 protein [Bryobacteraceae bacterium]
MKVTVFGDFAEDYRLSMDVYAAGLAASLRRLTPAPYEVEEYHPRRLPVGGCGPVRMRIARYAEYPLSSIRHAGALNHIIDQGYAHLIYGLGRGRTVVTVHDIIPMVRFMGRISGLAPGRKPALNLFSFRALRLAAHIVADSENTKRDLICLCGCSASMITVVHPGVDQLFRRYSREEALRARRTLGFGGGVYVLVSGSGEYKNHVGALRAFALVRSKLRRPCYLVKTGGATPEWARTVAELGLGGSVLCLGTVPRESLVDLYNSVDCLLFPSFYEGFGWPPLEAMACGTPVVTSDAASLPEVVGEAGIMVSPTDLAAIADALNRVLTDEVLRDCLVRKGLERVRGFSWDLTAQAVGRVYERVLATH